MGKSENRIIHCLYEGMDETYIWTWTLKWGGSISAPFLLKIDYGFAISLNIVPEERIHSYTPLEQ